jgi:hypothetical protein
MMRNTPESDNPPKAAPKTDYDRSVSTQDQDLIETIELAALVSNGALFRASVTKLRHETITSGRRSRRGAQVLDALAQSQLRTVRVLGAELVFEYAETHRQTPHALESLLTDPDTLVSEVALEALTRIVEGEPEWLDSDAAASLFDIYRDRPAA